MLISLITSEHYITKILPDWKDGHFFLKDPQNGNELFEIVGDGENWNLKSCGWNQVLDKNMTCLKSGSMIPVRLDRTMEKASVFVENHSNTYVKYARVLVPDTAVYQIGTDTKCNIVLKNANIAGRHAVLRCKNNIWSVESINNNCVYVNGRRIYNATLKPGDVISILNQKFIVLPGVLAMNAQNIVQEKLKGQFHSLKFQEIPQDKIVGKAPEPEFFHRRPRFTGGLFEKDISFVAPPDIKERIKRQQKLSYDNTDPASAQENNEDDDTLLTYGPSIASGLMMLLGGITNPIYGLGLLGSSLFFKSRQKQKEEERKRKLEAQRKIEEARRKEEAEKARREEERILAEERRIAERKRQEYKEYLRKLDRELDEINEKQAKQLLNFNHSAVAECAALLQNKEELWNRRQEHCDFLDIRLGTGNIPVKANINFPEEDYEDKTDSMYQMLRQIKEKPRMLRGVPIMLQLGSYYSVGISGPAALRESMAAQMILQLAMHIGYDELKLCILGKIPKSMSDLIWLPHTWNDEHTVHMVASDKDELIRLLPELDKQLRERRSQKSYTEESYIRGHLVFLIMDEELCHTGLVMRLLFDHPAENVHVISAAEHTGGLPRRTDLAIGVRTDKGRMLWQEGDSKETADFVPDVSILSSLPALVDLMANTRLDLRQEMNRMPDMVPFLSMFGAQDISQLNILNRWRRSNPMSTLAAPIGISEDGNICYLDLHERGDGPHGLVAGTTGSGKSEMLMNYILALACNYSPLELSLVLIDYKGGGMAQAFENLPHTAGIITNLDGNEITRSLMSLQSEMERRQKLFADCKKATGVRNIDIYKYQELYRTRRVTEPLSHLVVITDEFAELKTQQPYFLEQLIRAARIGRSLGIHLILATQKPFGVVDDQIWSNSNVHICLRVQDASDSREVIKCEDAVHLNKVGSLYKQVGYGEVLVKVQSGWTGADYAPKSIQLPDCYVEVLDQMGNTLRHEDLHLDNTNDKTQLEAVTDYLADLGAKTGLKARKLWTPLLNAKIPFASLVKRYSPANPLWELSPLIGEIDDPTNQCKKPLYLPLSSGKNTIVYGTDNSSLIMMLGTMMESLILGHRASEVHIYIVDCADDGMMIYQKLPQVGDVVSSDDDEKRFRLLSYLEEQIALRKKKLGSSLSNEKLSQRLKKAGLPNILVIIHHILAFQSLSDREEERIHKLFLDGPRYGISFLATQESAAGLRIKTAQLFPQKYVLQMDTDDDYMALLGRTNGMKPAAIRGRGLLRDDLLYEFQIASQMFDPEQLNDLAVQHGDGSNAPKIRVMPERITSADLAEYLRKDKPWVLPIGIGTQDIRTEYWNFKGQMVHLMIGEQEQILSVTEGLIKLAAANKLRVLILDADERIEQTPGKNSDLAIIKSADLDSTVEDMFAYCLEIATNKSEQIPPADSLVLIPNLDSVFDRLSSEKNGPKDKLMGMLQKAKPEYGWYFAVGGTAEDMQTHRFEAWFQSSVNTTRGIFLGGGLEQQSLLQADSFVRTAFDFPRGSLVYNKKVHHIKFMQEKEEEETIWNT